jgi:Flp pilus assembly protein TadD
MIQKAVDLEPENEAYLDSLGWVLFKLGRPQEALPWLEKAAKLSERPDATIEDHLGDVLAALHRWTEARVAWRRSLELEKNDAVQKKLERAPK